MYGICTYISVIFWGKLNLDKYSIHGEFDLG